MIIIDITTPETTETFTYSYSAHDDFYFACESDITHKIIVDASMSSQEIDALLEKHLYKQGD